MSEKNNMNNLKAARNFFFRRLNTFAVLNFALAFIFMGLDAKAAELSEKGSKFSVTPYFWFADIEGTIEHGSAGGSKETEVKVGTDDYFDNLELAVPLALEARFGSWAILSDFLYMKMTDQKSKVKSAEFGSGGAINIAGSANAGTNSTLELTGWTLLTGYRGFESKKGSFETTFGFRYFGIESKTDWNLSAAVSGPGPGESFQQSGSVKNSDELWDVLIGFRGQLHLGQSKLSVPYYIDFGSGESDFTWQGMTGLAYAFSWGEISANYRYLEYQTSSLVEDLRFGGPSIGITWLF